VFDVEGRVEALECSGLAEAVLYSQLPEGLNPSPILSLIVESEKAGETEVTISYLTRGLGWEADYRMDIPPQSREGSLLGWLTLTNGTSKNFDNVPTAIVAGTLREDLGDYKLYRTPEPVTVAPMQTKQIAFLSLPNVEADRVFAFNFPDAAEYAPFGATVEYRVDNSQEGNLAQPLPKGNFRVFTNRENGVPAYLGEDRVDNLAVDLPADIEVSQSIAVQMQSRIEGVTTGQGDDVVHEIHLTADLFNATPERVETEVEIREIFLRQDYISEASHPHDPDEIIPTYPISIAAESAERFKLTVPVQEIFYFDYYGLDFEDEEDIAQRIGRANISMILQACPLRPKQHWSHFQKMRPKRAVMRSRSS